MGKEETRVAGKTELLLRASDLMPQGSPDFKSMVYYPRLTDLVAKMGKRDVHMAIHILVMDFCRAFNVVRNMNEDQIIEAAAMLLDECGDFRLEDYVMMFTMAKRGELVDIRDRIDIQMIGKMLDNYWKKRHEAGKKIQEEQYQDYERSLKRKDIGFSNMSLRGFLGWGVLKEAYSHNFRLMMANAVGQWKQELSEERQAEQTAYRNRVAESYARLQNLNWEAIQTEFSNRKTGTNG